MAAVTTGVVGAATAAYGAYSANRNARSAQSSQNQALQHAQQNAYLGNFRANDWGSGAWAGFTDNEGTMGMRHGNLEGAYNSLRNIASNQIGSLNDPTALNNYQQALQGTDYAAFRNWNNDIGRSQALANFGGPNLQLQGLDQLQGQLGQAQATNANQFNTLAGQTQTYDQAYSTALGNLRAQAATQNDRAFSGLQDNLFATGRMGTSGGGLQMEAFARGLAEADAGYQLQAQQQGMMAQSQQQQMMNDAFGRWQQTSSMLGDLNSQRFQRSMYGNETDYQRLTDTFNRGIAMDQQQYQRQQDILSRAQESALFPSMIQDARLGNIQQLLSAQGGIQAQGLDMFNAGLNAQVASANARLGAGSNMAAIVGSPSFGAAGQASAAALSQLGGRLIDNRQGIADTLGGLWGRIAGR